MKWFILLGKEWAGAARVRLSLAAPRRSLGSPPAGPEERVDQRNRPALGAKGSVADSKNG